MIRINLLPREEKAHRQVNLTFKAGELVVPIAMFVAVLLVVAGTAMSQRMSATTLEKSIAEVEAQSRALAPQIERVNRLAQERAELDLRLGVISKLEKGRTMTVRLMDELARCIPDHLWLTSASQDDPTKLTVEGMTLSNLVVSDLMSNLERSPMFANVELEVAERGEAATHKVVKFRISCAVTPDEPAN
jgi:type IV pilus assembly protein PilN